MTNPGDFILASHSGAQKKQLNGQMRKGLEHPRQREKIEIKFYFTHFAHL
jgi:hypothetical protein